MRSAKITRIYDKDCFSRVKSQESRPEESRVKTWRVKRQDLKRQD